MKKSAIVILLIGFLLTACGSNQKQVENLLEGTSWELVFVSKHNLAEGIRITAVFQDGEVSGSSGCNTYSGSYETDGNKISFGPLASTLMACVEPENVMEQEYEYLTWLQEAQTLSVKQDELMIFRSDGEALTFNPKSQ